MLTSIFNLIILEIYLAMNIFHYYDIVLKQNKELKLTGPVFRLDATVKSGQNNKSHIALHSECANGMGGSPLPAGKQDQNIFSQSGSSKTYGSTLVSNREQFNTVF